ncbi:sugar-transfer associated ATP-grasp domain-containing protein [Pontibacter liquoris]|uniref:sugar-transfer associated ATP-grasp domain-containing protein n=1 Tax=Pontibacter liquoris TaxID=2905677 RepID=UPI001FA78F2D|nr:sugar-transfer associated ATP-grasp domain-containing protein [Pontibacter liquoris]
MLHKRLLYLGYYLRELDWAKLRSFLEYASVQEKKSKSALVADMLTSSLKYNISLLEYFQFRFYKLTNAERSTYAGTGFMYEYHLSMNPKSSRNVLEDKLQFLKHYKQFVKHKFASVHDIENNPDLAVSLLSNSSGKLVLKSSSGQCGDGIEVRISKDFDAVSLISRLKSTGNDLVEEFVVQHDALNGLSPSGLNTIRVFTQLTKDNKVEILGARLRMTVNSSVDNLAAGNIAAPINLETGIIDGAAIYSDITKREETVHPVTQVKIVGFQIPFWNETIKMVEQAALKNTENRSIGWDVAITNNGPELIEGNHNWCKLLWQLPVKKGLKAELLKYL